MVHWERTFGFGLTLLCMLFFFVVCLFCSWRSSYVLTKASFLARSIDSSSVGRFLSRLLVVLILRSPLCSERWKLQFIEEVVLLFRVLSFFIRLELVVACVFSCFHLKFRWSCQSLVDDCLFKFTSYVLQFTIMAQAIVMGAIIDQVQSTARTDNFGKESGAFWFSTAKLRFSGQVL